MDQEVARHEKIRFRRQEITNLHAFPSAAGLDQRLLRPSLARRATRFALKAAAGLLVLMLVAATAVYVVGAAGVGSERLRVAAEQALQDAIGDRLKAHVGPARLTWDPWRLLAAEVSDVGIVGSQGGADVAKVDTVRFGIDFLPLLSGEIRLGSAAVSGARITPAAMEGGGEGDWAEGIRDAQGLIDPDSLVAKIYSVVRGVLGAISPEKTRRIELAGVDVALSDSGEVRVVRILDATLRPAAGGALGFSGNLEIDGRPLALTAEAAKDPASDKVSSLEATISMADSKAQQGPEPSANRIGAIEVKLQGREGVGDRPTLLSVGTVVKDFQLDLGSRGILAGDLALSGLLAQGTKVFEVTDMRLALGRSLFNFTGAIGPKPAQQQGATPVYRYELISRAATIAPGDSPEAGLSAQIRLGGTFEPSAKVILADTLFVRGGNGGEVLGNVRVELVAGKAPGIALDITAHDMPVSSAKQLWPWFAARNARSWVMQNLFGGRLVEGSLQYRVVPGRIGNGVPLSAAEVSGRFDLEGSRFDTAGRIPPVRDAVGTVVFGGNDVEISLKSGTAFMPSGRTVAASNGMLRIADAHLQPVIGALEIDVAGDAPAIAELASNEPINAMRFVGLKPEEFSGEMAGHVSADIPLQRGVDDKRLGWRVALDYRNLSVAKPFDGQLVTEATGNIVVEPDRALIKAKAKLNGVSAEIDLVEPLGDGGPERDRNVMLVLDDKARESFVPGLSQMIDGTIKVSLDQAEGGIQNVKADLADARLSIPWVGWSKGPGIPATVVFALKNADGRSTLTDFKLSGETFGIEGDVVLSKGSLAEASFGKVVLNRGDKVAVTIKRSGKGYAVAIKGEALDARAIVKQFTSDVDTATKASDTGSISISADVASLTGFNGEKFSAVKLDYSGSGTKVNGLTVQAATDSGAAVDIRNSAEGGNRQLGVKSTDAGAVLRFLDIYGNMEGGKIALALAAKGDGPLRGNLDVTNFWIVNEPRLSSLVSSRPEGDTRSLNEAVKRDIDTSRAQFERGYSVIEKGAGYLNLVEGVLRGPLIGLTFQGSLYDKAGNMDMTGTFMPAYGLNRIFGELPLVGVILGNGRDRGLIGVTFRLHGDANEPKLQVNPLSIVAPGIFRQIFEYR